MKKQEQDKGVNQAILLESGIDDLISLEQKILKLKDVADQIDPYSPLTLSMQLSLKELSIEITSDPFRLTNQILKTMEDALETREALRESLGLSNEPDTLFADTTATKH